MEAGSKRRLYFDDEEDGLIELPRLLSESEDNLEELADVYVEMRRELVELMTTLTEEEFLSRIAGRYDYIWFLIFSYSFLGSHFHRLRRLRQMVPPGTLLYRSLQNGADLLHRWGVVGSEGSDPDEVEVEMWEEWPEQEQNQEEAAEMTEDVLLRLFLLLGFAFSFEQSVEMDFVSLREYFDLENDQWQGEYEEEALSP